MNRFLAPSLPWWMSLTWFSEDGRLWISYYSSHEGKTSIYLAQVKFAAQGSATN